MTPHHHRGVPDFRQLDFHDLSNVGFQHAQYYELNRLEIDSLCSQGSLGLINIQPSSNSQSLPNHSMY